MATKKLAKELGLVRKRSRPSNEEQIHCRQLFSYLIVIDFESTCWRDNNNYGQEIIEFPAVLLNTVNGKIDSEFHTYVQPQEHPILSKFCTELTGIRQAQVEAGVPLQICLSQFTRWIQTLQQERNIVFVKAPTGHPCAFVTWSDWDLGVCLQYECKRKQICKPDILNSWIDLRATYKLFYNRKPKGLNGALQDLGIEFCGREHSGLDDARNTAHLAWRMMTDGCFMKITRCLDQVSHRALLGTKPLFQMNPNTANVGGHHVTEEGVRRCVIKQTMPAQSSGNKLSLEMCSNPEIFQYQSLVLPKTLLRRVSAPVKGKTSVPACQLGSKGSPLSGTAPFLLNNGLVLVSTTVGCNTSAPELDPDNSATLLGGWEETRFLVESEESCSYDDVLLEDDDAPATPFMDCGVSQDSNGVQLNGDGSVVNASNSHSNQIVFRNSNTTVYSLEKARTFPSSSGVFKTPLLSNGKLMDKIRSHSNAPCSTKPRLTCAKEKSQRSGICMTTPSSSFAIYKDQDESRLSSGRLSSVPSLILSSSVNGAFPSSRGTMKMTSPLCTCGRRAKRLTVANGGPNHGRGFFSCPIGKMGSGNKKSCGFFKWESSLLKAKTASVSTSSRSVPGASFMSSGKSFSGKSLHLSPHKKFVMRPSLRN